MASTNGIRLFPQTLRTLLPIWFMQKSNNLLAIQQFSNSATQQLSNSGAAETSKTAAPRQGESRWVGVLVTVLSSAAMGRIGDVRAVTNTPLSTKSAMESIQFRRKRLSESDVAIPQLSGATSLGHHTRKSTKSRLCICNRRVHVRVHVFPIRIAVSSHWEACAQGIMRSAAETGSS